MKRSEMIEKIANEIYEESYKLNNPQPFITIPQANQLAEAALRACEDAGMLPPLYKQVPLDSGGKANWHDWEPESEES